MTTTPKETKLYRFSLVDPDTRQEYDNFPKLAAAVLQYFILAALPPSLARQKPC